MFEKLAAEDISDLYPGFDILTIKQGEIDRMIELKSSGVDAQVHAMSWNEWKTAKGTSRSHFWLYLVGNLRADLQNAAPFVMRCKIPSARRPLRNRRTASAGVRCNSAFARSLPQTD